MCQPIGDPFLNEQARAGAAHLSLIEPDRIDDALDHTVEIRVVEHDEWALAAELEGELLAAAGGRLANDTAHFGRAGEGDFLHVGMLDQEFAGRPVTGDDVEYARGQAGGLRDLCKTQRGQWRELRGLQDHGVSGGECRRDLPRDHQQREVPRDDLPDDADRHVAGELGVTELRPPGVVIEVPGDQRDVEIARLTNRFAVVETLEHGEQPGVALHLARERVQIAGACVRRQRRPAWGRGSRPRDGGVDVSLAPLRDAGENRCGRGVDRLEVLSFHRSGPPAIDEMAEPPVVVLPDPLQRGCVAFRRRPVLHRLEQLGDGRHYTIGWRCAAA